MVSKIPDKEWNEILKRVELVSVTPCKMHTERIGNLHALNDIHRDIDVGVTGSHSLSENGDYLLVLCVFNTRFGDDEQSFECEVSYQLLYSFDPPIEDDLKDAADQFAQMNSTFNAWPYYRHHAQMLSVELGLSPITVPLYKPKTMKFKDKDKAIDKPVKPKKIAKKPPKRPAAKKAKKK